MNNNSEAHIDTTQDTLHNSWVIAVFMTCYIFILSKDN